jgi:hypothetical protein
MVHFDKLMFGPKFLGAVAVGDQLSWCAAEPLQGMLRILREHLDLLRPSRERDT